MGEGAPPPPAAAPPPPPPVEWHYMDLEHAQQGPITEDGLRRLYDDGDLHDFTLVWNHGLPSWQPIKDVLPDVTRSIAGYQQQTTAYC